MASAVIGALRVNLGIDSATFQNGLKQAQTGLQKFGSYAKTGLIAVGAAATAAAAGIGYAVKQTIDSADEMSKTAAKIGVPIEELSRLKYAADLSGVSFEGLQTAVGRLSRVMNDAKNGSKEAVDTFSQLGISATNVDGSLKSASQVLQEVSDRFAAMPDGAEKTALAMELMGRSGANMIPLLNGGAEAMAKLMGEADTFGQVFTAEMGTQAEAFNDNLTRLTGTIGNLAARIATQLLPHLERFTNWLVANAPAIANFVVSVVEGFAKVVTAISSVIQFFDNLDRSIRSMGDAMRASLAAAFEFSAQLVQAFMAIPGQMLEIGAQIVDGLWQGIRSKWETVKSGITGLATGLVDSVKNTLGIRSPSRVMAEVGVNIMQGLHGGMQSLSGDISSFAEGIAGTIANAFQGVIQGSKTVGEAIGDVLKQLSSMLLHQGFKYLTGALGGGGGFLGKIFGGLFGGFFANGGTLGAGKWGIAGEAGPEIIKGPAQAVPLRDIEAGPQEIMIRGVFVDDNGVIKGQITSMGQQAAQAGASIGFNQVKQSFPGLMANAQARNG